MAAPTIQNELSMAGAGIMARGDTGETFPGYEECRLAFTTETLDIPYKDIVPGILKVPLGTNITLFIAHHQLTPDLIALELGATVVDDIGMKPVVGAPFTVPGTPWQVSLPTNPTDIVTSAGGVMRMLTVYDEDANGRRQRLGQVAAAAEAQDLFSCNAAGEMTFVAGNEGDTLKADYWITTTSGHQLLLDPNITPTPFEFLGSMRLVAGTGETDLWASIHCKKVIPQWPKNFGEKRKAHDPTELECSVQFNDNTDVIVYIEP